MTKKLFSMLLVLSMILTMLPIGVMAEEVDSAVGEKGEIIAFAPLKETEKKVHQGTSLEGLDLPETLSAKVKLSMPEDAVSDKVYGPEKGETFVDIPVTWISQPKYQMNTEGVYVFIPVIEGYTLAEEVKLPQIAVIVETDALMVKMAGPMAAAQAQWGTGTEDTVPDTWESGKLSDAISYANALTSGTAYIQLLQNVTLSAPLIIEGNQDIVLDLNDKTLDGDVQYAIQHNGSGTLTITGSGKITSKNVGNWGTICLTGEGSSLDVKSGIVENTATGWELNCTIHASRASNVSVSGGTIYSGGRAIDFASHDGSVYISAGTLKGRIAIDSSTYNNNLMISGGLLEGTDAAISSRGSGGNIVISGSAEVKSTNGNAISIKTGRNITITDTAKVESINGCAIDSSGKVKITISGTAKVTSGNNNLAQGTIYPYNLSDGAVVEIQGGTIENTAGGNAVYIPYKAQLIIKEDCDAVIKGGNMAINKAPDLSGYIYARILGSTTSADGTGAADILLEDIDTDEKVQAYKYLQFEPGPYVARIGGTTYTDLQDAMDAVGENETIILLKDISGNFTITKINPFTLDLNGKTLDGGSYAAITHQGSGILTVADRIGSGKITSTTNINGTIYLIVGSLEVKGGTVENSASGDTRAVYNLGIGSVKVSGGTVISYGSEALSAAIYNFHLGDVYVFDGTVESKGSAAIRNETDGNVFILGGTVKNTKNGMIAGSAIYNSGIGKITIGGTAKVVCADLGDRSIYLAQGFDTNTVLEIQGGTIESTSITGIGIYNNANGKIVIKEGSSAVVKGGLHAMNKAPDLSGYDNVKIMGGRVSVEGEDAQEISKNEIAMNVENYKYLEFVPKASYTITYDANGGTGAMADGTAIESKAFMLPANGFTTPAGKRFKTWAIGSADSSTLVNAGEPCTVTENTTIFAVWEDITYTITYDANGGTGAMADGTAIEGEAFMLPANGFTPPAGMQFKAWAIGSPDGEQKNPGETYPITGNTAVYAIWKPIPAATYLITATAGTGGSISPSGSVTIDEGQRITFTVTPGSNYSIADVKVDGVSQGKITSYTFDHVNANHTIAATFSLIGGGSGGGGGSSGGSGSGSGDGRSTETNTDNSIIVISPSPDNSDYPTQAEITVSGTTDSEGNVTINIPEQTVADALHRAMEDAEQNGNNQKGIILVFRVETDSRNVSGVHVNLPKSVQEAIIKNRIITTVILVDNPDIQISMDLAAVKEINRQADADVNVTATRNDSSRLTEEARKAIGGRPVFELTVHYGSGQQVQEFGNGSVTITIPYPLGENEKAENICAVYIDENGGLHWLSDSAYDSEDKVLRFSTNHFSLYGVGYKEEAPVFADIAGHWAEKDIEFVVSKGLFSGTSAATFSPNMAMTRGMFVTVLGKLAKADVSSYQESSFADVQRDAYYMGYIEWASQKGLVKGIGNGNFAPNQPITREQMAVIMENYGKAFGLTLPKVRGENNFADSAAISAYAKDAIQKMQMAGILSGKNNNLFDPQGTATRAEVSTVLHRFMEVTGLIDAM